MNSTLSTLVAAGVCTLLAAGCGGAPVDGAEDAVAQARATSLGGGATLNSCLSKAGYNVTDPAAVAEDVEVRSFIGGGDFFVVTFTSGRDEIRLTVLTEKQFVYAYDDADAALLEKAGCAMDGEPLNETSH